MEEVNIISFESKIDKDYKVFIIYKEHNRYVELIEIMESLNNSMAILDMPNKNIFIDGEMLLELNHDHLLAIQAHEICHSVLDHRGGVFENDEIEADLSAINLLKNLGYLESSEILTKRLLDLRGIEYSDELFENSLNAEKNKKIKNYIGRLKNH
jgi:hypothetical protein